MPDPSRPPSPPPAGDPRVAPALAWLRDHVPGVDGNARCTLIAGGRSNLTYRIVSATGSWVLHRPPEGPLLPRAHDMRREQRILAALHAHAAVPVPRPVALCVDETVLGVPFYVMEDVAGRVLRSPADAADLDEVVRARLAEDAVDVLATLHAVDVDRIGLGDLGPRDDYVGRQLRRWLAQVERSGDVEMASLLRRQQAALQEAVPRRAHAALVHGDYRFDNLVVDTESARVRAVLDWEIATIGDPVADFASFLVYWDEPGDERHALNVPGPTAAGGFPSRREVARRYAARAGLDLTDLDPYLAFAYWKLACILQGVAHRYRSGAGGGGDGLVDGVEDHLHWLVERSHDHLAGRRSLEA